MIRRFSPAIFLFAASVAAASLVVPNRTAGAAMNDYCQVPPYVVQNIPPNVLILLDISGSMMNNAYFDGIETRNTSADDIGCTINAPCMKYNYTGRLSTHRYYGYFDPYKWYTYVNGVFIASASTSKTPGDSLWSGDFLNWLTMRRIDIMRKVLTGGRPNGDKIDGEIPDYDGRGLFKRITSADAGAYTPFTTTGNKDVIFIFGTGNAGTSSFDAYQAPNNTTSNNVVTSSDKITSQVSNQSIKVNVQVPLPVEGVLQTVVGARARVGLEFYHVNDGGAVVTDVGKNKTVGTKTVSSLSDTINQINLSRPSTNTPLAEALWTATGYFAQQNTITGYTSPADTGPNYANDYGTSNNSDPVNFGTGGTPRWPICQKNFVLLMTDGEPCSDGRIPSAIRDYPIGRSPFQCVDNTTSPWNYQTCPAVSGLSIPASSLVNDVCVGTGVKSDHGDESGVEDVALFMHTNDLRNYPTIGTDNIAGFQNITLYTVFAFGHGSTLLQYASINGGFENSGPTDTPSTASPFNWDRNGDGVPDTYFDATEGAELERAVRDAFSGILKRASSGTAASVLASGEGSGANLIQAVFYPRRAVGNDIIGWAGSLQNLWYYVDPFFANATIREDTSQDNVLNLATDDIVQFHFDPVSQLTQVKRWHSDNNGLQTTADTTLSFENVHSLWEAGKKLWQRTSARTIYTNNIGGTLDASSTMTVFSTANATELTPYLLESSDNAVKTINYIAGIDNTDDPDLRSRTVTFGSDNNVWKLGDVVNSTPRIVASVALNKYDTVFNDTTYKAFITDNTAYLRRGMVFTGGNDGMLHAFRLGKLELSWTGKTAVQKAKLSNPYSGTTLGDEAWGFIPKNALPYLKYLKDPDYCHLFYTDLAPYVFDASIGSGSGDQSTQTRTKESWRTVIIGGMRTGGACDNGASCTTANNCVKTPEGGAVGFSSYFALDVTDPTTPSLLWEFSNPNLGFTTTGPAVVRINAVNTSTSNRDRSLNGEWYVVFGSGPTGPIDNTNNQFLGRSNQNLRFFVVNLKTGALVQTIETGITEAFAGSMINTVADFNLDYQDDAFYVGYVKKTGTGTSATWTDGGVGRIVTSNATPTNGSGGSWKWSRVIDGIGPVTSAVARLQNKNFSTNWLYFGTGRYFFEIPPTGTDTTPSIDDATGQRRLFGIKDPCFTSSNTINPACTSSVTFSTTDLAFPDVTTFTNVPEESTANSAGFKGWYIDLDPSATYTYDNTSRLFRAERVITDPLATTSGVVFFTTYKPYGDECALGGKSFLWALRYNTGGAPSGAVMKGKALVQVSTASVEQMDLATAFQKASGEGAGGLHKDGRRTGAIEGVPPTAQGLSLLSQPPPVKRIMHMMER